MSQAPGLSGMPDLGHCSSAATSASCASSSAVPTSRTIRIRPPISFACSILKTASMARCVSVAVTGYRLTLLVPMPQAGSDLGRLQLAGLVAHFLAGTGDLTDFGFALPARHMLAMQLHEAAGAFDHRLLRRHVEDGIAADHLLGLGERPVHHRDLAAGEPDPCAIRRGEQAPGLDHDATLLRAFL